MLNKDYQIQRQELIYKKLTTNSLPYLFEYYTDICKNPLVTNYNLFSQYFQQFLSIPIKYTDIYMINPIDELFHNKIKKIIEHLDKKYEEN